MATVQKRGNSYRIRVSAGYDSRGKQIVKTMTWKPTPGMTERQEKKELERQKVLFERTVSSGEYFNESRMRLSDFFPKYLEIEKGKLAPTTYTAYSRIINNYIVPALGHLRLKDIKPLHVQLFVRNLSDDNLCKATRREKTKSGESVLVTHTKKFSSATIRRYYVVLQSILHSACKLGLVPSNPADDEKIELPPLEPSKTEIFTKDEAADMLNCLSAEPLMWQCLINLAIVSGCRRGELVALQWSDIDFDGCTVSISKSVYQLKGQPVSIKQPKTAGSVRIIAIPQFIVDMLKDYEMEQRETRLKCGDQWQGGNWVFVQWNGAVMYPSSPSQWFSRFLKRHNLPHKKFHALRHTSATLLLTSGSDIKEVSSRLGHSQLSTTNRYLHTVAEADKEAAQAFADMFSKQDKNGAS